MNCSELLLAGRPPRGLPLYWLDPIACIAILCVYCCFGHNGSVESSSAPRRDIHTEANKAFIVFSHWAHTLTLYGTWFYQQDNQGEKGHLDDLLDPWVTRCDGSSEFPHNTIM